MPSLCASPLAVGNTRWRLFSFVDMAAMLSRIERIRALLGNAFSPFVLDVQDDSARHSGHAGARPGGETHFNILLVSAAFRGRGRLQRHRAVQDALASEFAGGLHALSLTLRTPEEHSAE